MEGYSLSKGQVFGNWSSCLNICAGTCFFHNTCNLDAQNRVIEIAGCAFAVDDVCSVDADRFYLNEQFTCLWIRFWLIDDLQLFCSSWLFSDNCSHDAPPLVGWINNSI